MPSSDLISPQAGTALHIHAYIHAHKKFFQRKFQALISSLVGLIDTPHPAALSRSLSLALPFTTPDKLSMQAWLLWNMPYRADQSHTSVDPPASASQNLGIRHKPSFLNAQSLFIGWGGWKDGSTSNTHIGGSQLSVTSRESYVLFYLQGHCMHVVKHPYT